MGDAPQALALSRRAVSCGTVVTWDNTHVSAFAALVGHSGGIEGM